MIEWANADPKKKIETNFIDTMVDVEDFGRTLLIYTSTDSGMKPFDFLDDGKSRPTVPSVWQLSGILAENPRSLPLLPSGAF
jgi:hypothetical protein